MTYCIFDTETSGLFDWSRPADAEGQPRLASIAMLACDDELRLVAATCVVVRPEGWTMSADAERVNGLSQEFLMAHGVPVCEVLARYAFEIDSDTVMVAHNAQYDLKIMRGELRRDGRPDFIQTTRSICTMRSLTETCALPKLNGRGLKFPKLSEALMRCLNRDHHGAHGALHDALATLDLLRWMKANIGLPQPTRRTAT